MQRVLHPWVRRKIRRTKHFVASQVQLALLGNQRLSHGSICPEPQAPARWPSGSRDGRWIYFSSNRARGTWHDGEIWRMPAAGGEAIQVTRQGAHVGSESFDGKYIYFTKEFWETTIWRVPT